jgi:hypothetical protein
MKLDERDNPHAWIPASGWIRTYSGRRLRLDLIAGLSLAAFVIPESLAYASLAQLPPVTGLYCPVVAHRTIDDCLAERMDTPPAPPERT